MCHFFQLLCHFTLLKNCPRPFHIFYSSRATLCSPFSIFTTESASDCQQENTACRLLSVFCIYFSYLNDYDWLFYILFLLVFLLFMLTKTHKIFVWKGKDKTNQASFLCRYSTFSNEGCIKLRYCIFG